VDTKAVIILIAVGVCVILVLALSGQIVETVDKGTYVIKQSATTGELTAHMKPGPFGQWFGSITVWPVAETFYFTKDSEGTTGPKDVGDDSIEVRFNDGSVCKISGTCRVDMPRSEDEAIKIITEHGYRSHDQVETKLILPVIRRSLIMTANLMSAKESYSDRRADFFKYAWDQIDNGVYVTKDESTTEMDAVTNVNVTKVRKTILLDKDGKPQREKNPLEGTGIHLSNFEIKNFVYEDRVQKQIATQQEALMAVQTARANAQKAQQDSLTVEAEGKAAVMKAKYEEEQKKIRAEVQAQQEQAVAVIAAQKQVDVATKDKEQALVVANRDKEVAALALETARLEKQKQIEIGTGEAERKRLVLAADGALAQKLEAWGSAQKVWADAFSNRKVPSVVMAGGGSADNDATSFMEILGAKAARDLALDMSIPSTPAPAPVVVPVSPKK
jgi:hypothetical protein